MHLPLQALLAFDRFLFPPHCLVSGAPLHDQRPLLPGVSNDGWFQLPAAPEPDALLAHLARRFGADSLLISSAHALIAIDEQGAGLHILHAIKYRGRQALALALGRLLGEVLIERCVTADAVAAVPIHRSRLRERGFNQAHLIAQGACDAMSLPLTDSLIRTRYTGTQTSLGVEERAFNISGSIAVADSSYLRGKRILVIDDVLTTGATLHVCAEAIIAAGARRVDVAAVAATG